VGVRGDVPTKLITRLRLSELGAMSEEDRARALGAMAVNGVELDAEVRALELRYEMTSDTMRSRVKAGGLDTADTAKWLVLLAALGR